MVLASAAGNGESCCMLRRTPSPPSVRDRKLTRFAATAITAIVGLVAVSLSSTLTSEATAATSSSSKAKKVTTTTRKRVVRTTTTRRRAVGTTATTPSTIPSTTQALPTVATAAPTQATLPTTSTTTTTTAPAFDFDVLVPTPAQSVAAGSSASFVVIVATKAPSTPRAVTFIATGIPEGANATLSPNPTSSGAEFRINVGANVAVGTYTIRLIGSAANVSKTTNVFISVTAATGATNNSTTTTTTTRPGPTTSTIVVGVGASTFAVAVSTENNRLRSGNTVSYFIRIIYASGFSTPAALQVNGLPNGVSGGFSAMSTEGTATLFVSSTVAIVPGTYTFNVTAAAGSYQQFVPVTLIIE